MLAAERVRATELLAIRGVRRPFLRAGGLEGSSLALGSGPPRAEIEVVGGCVLLQRPLPSSSRALVNPFPGGCITGVPPLLLSELLTRDCSLLPPRRPCGLLHHVATSFSGGPQESTAPVLPLLLRDHWLEAGPLGQSPLE